MKFLIPSGKYPANIIQYVCGDDILYILNRAVGSNFQLVRPRYCDHNTAACNRQGQGVGVGGGCSPFRAKRRSFNVFILENSTLYYSNI